MTAASSPSRRGLVQIALAGVLWGTGGLVVQLVRSEEPMSVLTISAWRMALAAVVLLVALLVLRQRPRAAPRCCAPGLGPRVVVGLCTGAYQALYFAAVVAAGVTVSTVVAPGAGAGPADRGRESQGATPAERAAASRARRRARRAVLVSAAAGLSITGPRRGRACVPGRGLGDPYALATALGRSLTRRHSPLAWPR